MIDFPPGSGPRISIVVLTNNRCSEVCRTLKRLVELPGRYPIIVVDNGSTDETVSRIESGFPGVTLVRASRNLGAAGRNLGVLRAHTPYVAFCDDDTWWDTEALSTAVKILEARPELTILNARILVGPEARPDTACYAMAQSPLEQVGGVGPRLTGFMAGAIVMRTQAFLAAGGYWEPFFIGGEETLLAMDVLDAGGGIAYAPALVVFHWPSKLRDVRLRQRMIARNALWTVWLRLPWAIAVRRTMQSLAELPGLGARVRVLFDALYGWPQIYKQRRLLKPATCRLLEKVWRYQDSSGTGQRPAA
ncbi:MAG TPA: glycosyltransferase [Eoetvoesiella sp.]